MWRAFIFRLYEKRKVLKDVIEILHYLKRIAVNYAFKIQGNRILNLLKEKHHLMLFFPP